MQLQEYVHVSLIIISIQQMDLHHAHNVLVHAIIVRMELMVLYVKIAQQIQIDYLIQPQKLALAYQIIIIRLVRLIASNVLVLA